MKFQINLSNGESIVVTSPNIDSLFDEINNPLSIGYLKTEAGTYINVNHIASIREMENWE